MVRKPAVGVPRPARIHVAEPPEALDRLLARAVRATGQSICVADVTAPDQPVVWVNAAFTATTGFTFADAVGRNCRFLQDGLADEGYDMAAPVARLRELVRTRRSGTIVVPNRRADGRVFWNEVSLAPLPEASGVRYYMAVQNDVTERVLAERARDRSYAEAAELADQLQHRLVPRALPAAAAWDVAVRYQPATRADGSRGEVSGDFYDLRLRPDGHVLAVLGDVSGRGPRAAATTAALRWSIRGLTGVVDGPAALLGQVADAVHDALDDRFATVAAVRLPDASGTVGEPVAATVALAGAPQPVLLPATGPASFVGRPGMLLGPFADVDISDEDVVLAGGDALVLYTDGVTEAADHRRRLLGDEGLLAALEAAPATGRTADVVADAVLGAVARHVDGGPLDDLTLMVVRRRLGTTATPG